jgi:hypothetical protein
MRSHPSLKEVVMKGKNNGITRQAMYVLTLRGVHITTEMKLGRNVNFTVTVFVKSQILSRLISFPIIQINFLPHLIIHFMFLGHSTEDSLFRLDTGCYS